jgi:hypothetical protein
MQIAPTNATGTADEATTHPGVENSLEMETLSPAELISGFPAFDFQ